MQKTTTTKYVDYLTEDTPIPGQLWVCVSFLSPEGVKNCTVRGLKIRGIYGTKPEAEKRAEELNKIDPDFHVFVGEVGKWLPWDPEPDSVQDNVYQEKELNDLMKAYKENREKAKQMQQERKEDMIKKAAIEEQAKLNKNDNNKNHDANKARDKLRKKLEDRQNKASENVEEPKELTEREKELQQLEERVKEQDNYIKEEKNKLEEATSQVAEKEQTLNTINDKLAKIQELYKKLNDKK